MSEPGFVGLPVSLLPVLRVSFTLKRRRSSTYGMMPALLRG